MSYLLDIIIPIYNTKQEYMTRLLNSINRQKNINFREIGIIIVDDKSTKIKYKKGWFRQRYPKLNITLLQNEVNVGAGVTRQNGLDYSTATYVTFVDSDDLLYDDDVIAKCLSTIISVDVNLLTTTFIEEVTDDYGEIKILTHTAVENGLKCLHGTFINRQFLVDNDIRFHDKIRIFEDSYFMNILLQATRNSNACLDLITYIWKWNDSSLVRENIEKMPLIIEHFEDSYCANISSAEWLLNHLNINDVLTYIIIIFADLESNYFIYYMGEEKKKYYEKLLFEFYLKYKNIISYTKEIVDAKVAGHLKARLLPYGNYEIQELFEDYIARMEKTYPELLGE